MTLADEVDCSRGDVIAAADDPPEVADQFEATIVWMADERAAAGPRLLAEARHADGHAPPSSSPKYEINVNTLEHLAAKTLELNAIGVAELATDRADRVRALCARTSPTALGGFILIDKLTNATVGAGMLHFALRRSQNVHWQAPRRQPRDARRAQGPEAGGAVVHRPVGRGQVDHRQPRREEAARRAAATPSCSTATMSATGSTSDLGFTEADRIENIRRVGEVARLMADAGLIVLTAFISPFRAERRHGPARCCAEGEFIEIFVDTPLAEAEKRDVKGLYAKARAGELKNFTGIDSPYEAPENAEIRIDTTAMSAEEAADLIVEKLTARR